MKSLYVEGSEASRLVLDGPSLQVLAEGTAPRRFPLRMLRRIVLGGRVECEAAALEQYLAGAAEAREPARSAGSRRGVTEFWETRLRWEQRRLQRLWDGFLYWLGGVE